MNGLKSKRWGMGLLFCWVTFGTMAQSTVTVQRCGIVAREQILRERDPQRLQKQQLLNEKITEIIRQQADGQRKARIDEVIYQIPVVVHVVHTNSSGFIGGAGNPNISDEQIASQIQVLNEDYRRMFNTRGFNTNPSGADTGIEFYLAKTDPEGKFTTGITRNYYPQKTSFDVYSASSGDDLLLSQIAYWPSDQYLNIWVTALKNDYLGYSQFPAVSGIAGLFPNETERTDGVIIDYRYFGREIGTVTSSTYRYGRTATHEIGHWLGLLHTWGDANCGTDYCDDTPPTEGPNQTTSCPEKYSNCNGVNGVQTRNQIENYLDYSPDGCMNLFTVDQKARMRAVIEASPRRRSVVRSAEPLPEAETLTVDLGPNPAFGETPMLKVLLKGRQTFQVSILDLAGRVIKTQEYANYGSSVIPVSTTTLASGMYIIKIDTGRESATRRLLVR